jgi:hypothetical protein
LSVETIRSRQRFGVLSFGRRRLFALDEKAAARLWHAALYLIQAH